MVFILVCSHSPLMKIGLISHKKRQVLVGLNLLGQVLCIPAQISLAILVVFPEENSYSNEVIFEKSAAFQESLRFELILPARQVVPSKQNTNLLFFFFSPSQPPSKVLSSILGKSNLQFAGMSIMLNISTTSLNLMTPDTKQVSASAMLICETLEEQPTAQVFAVCQKVLFHNNVYKMSEKI